MSFIGKPKKISDSNKENITPSSSFKSPVGNLSLFEENSMKLLNDQKESVTSNAEWISSENYKLFLTKEDLTRSVIENESSSHKDKTDCDKLNDILREKEFRNELLIQNMHEPNYWLTTNFFTEMVEYDITSSQSFDFKLKNDYVINASVTNSKGTATCNKIYNRNQNTSTKNDLLDKDNEPLAIKYFMAYNMK